MATTTHQTTSSSRRRTFIPAWTRSRDRFSYLWLALAIVLLPFGTARWTIPLAAWLYPVFLLRFVRTQPLWRGILLALLATVLVLEVAWQGFLPFPWVLSVPLVFVVGVIITLPYLIDRVVAPRLGGMLGTLVFPLAVTTVWYLNALLNPLVGTWVNPAYTQYGNLPLLQLLSVTGLWGIIFVMSWLASVVNWAWERSFAWPRVRGGAALYASLLALVLLFGGVRLALFPAQASTVRVAGITPSHAVIAAAEKPISELSQNDVQALISGKATQVTGTYLDLGMVMVLQQPVQSHFFLDESILIDPTGSVVWRYEKAHPAPGEQEAPGDGNVPTVQTPYGRLATVVCYDADFPGTMRQAGQAGADIMLVPSNDWQAYDPYHTQLITFRAIENGYSLVRQTSNGLAMAVDYEGHVLAASDYFTTDPQVMVAYVPMQGVRTIYAMIGDLFAWLSVAGLVVLIGVAIARRRKAGEAGEAAPISAESSSGEPIEAVSTSGELTEPRLSSGEPPAASPT